MHAASKAKASTTMVVLVLAMTLIGGCGWQLRGSTTALSGVMDSLHLTGSDRYTPLMTTLRQRIEASDVRLSETAAGADYTLAITAETLDKRVASVGADALASAYDLTLSVRFDVLDAAGRPLARGLTSQVQRSFNASGAGAGGDSQEETMVSRELRETLARQLLRRLQAVIKAAPEPEPEPTDNEPPHGQTES